MPMTYDELKFSTQQRKRAGQYLTCENCKREFYLAPCFIKDHEDPKHKRGRFCSRKCQKEYYQVIKVCINCGKEFSVPRGIADRYNACSWKCRKISIYSVICQRCGKEFITNERRWKPKYCSEECRRPPVIISCEVCGKAIRKMPQDTDRRFCSLSCYRKSNGETSIEKEIRIKLNSLNYPYAQEVKIGRYSVDFLVSGKVVIEVDGDYWHKDKAKDNKKDLFLQSRGYIIHRISENEIHQNTYSPILVDVLSQHLQFT